MGLKAGIITEAPVNDETIPMRRIVKGLKSWQQKYEIRKIASRAQFVLAIPNSKYAYFHRLGWREDQIFPFGYFVTGMESVQSSLPEWAKRVKEFDRLKIKILYVGTFTAKKGPDLLIHALGILNRAGSEFVCYLIGDGEQRKYLEDLIQRNGLNDNVIFFGVRPNDQYRALLKNCDIIVVPQRRASWGVPALEAIQSGVAIVISDGDGASELVKISGTGRVFKSGDWFSLYSALHDLLSSSTKLNEAKERTILFAKKIHPTIMAEYLNKVLLYVEGDSTKKPAIPWLESSS